MLAELSDPRLDDAISLARSAYPRTFGVDGPHVVSRPVHVEGAMPGDLLAMTLVPGAGDWGALKSLDSAQWSALLYLSLVCSVLGYLAWNFALSRIEASRASVWIYAEPVVALALGVSILGESYGGTAFAGAAAIAVSVIVVNSQRMGGFRRAGSDFR